MRKNKHDRKLIQRKKEIASQEEAIKKRIKRANYQINTNQKKKIHNITVF